MHNSWAALWTSIRGAPGSTDQPAPILEHKAFASAQYSMAKSLLTTIGSIAAQYSFDYRASDPQDKSRLSTPADVMVRLEVC